MTSKMVSDRLASVRAVQGSLEQNADAIATRIAARLRSQLRSGERMPDVALLATLLGRELASQADVMVRADHAHEGELADDVGPRAARDRHFATLREVLIDLRGAVGATYGDEALSLLRLAEPVSTSPSVLAEQGQAVREALLDASIKLPKPRRRGARLDRDALAEELSESVLGLQKALADVDRERKEADVTVAAKSAAVDVYDAAFGRIVPVISALYALAEQDALAAKLRVSPRRSGTLEEPPAPTPVPPAES